ncbi:MAG TPA: hypothetical protein VHM69_05610 [Rubrobacter sp.]|nr:hypothetical protein [Rubrobacter sp.]
MALRRLLLLGTPLVLAPLMVVHQLIDQFERPEAFLALHLILLPLFALMGVAIWELLAGIGGAVAWTARAAAFIFIVGYVALDAISGIAASAILASGAPWSAEAARALFASGPAALPTTVAVLAWRLSVLLTAWALYRNGRPLAPLVLLLATALWLNNDHGGLRGVVVFGCFALAVAWLEFSSGAPRRPVRG